MFIQISSAIKSVNAESLAERATDLAHRGVAADRRE
jgi:hypothetical protein